MRMYKILGGIVLFVFLLQACAPTTENAEADFNGAKASDDVATYKMYLSMHPDSEHKEWIEERIAYLEKKETAKKEKKQKQDKLKNEDQLRKIRDYQKQIGVLTDQDFLEKDKWTLAKSDGVIGIVGVYKSVSSSEFLLGMFPPKSAPITTDPKHLDWIQHGEKVANASVMQGLKENSEYSYQLPEDDYNLLCVLTFSPKDQAEARILSDLFCNEDEM